MKVQSRYERGAGVLLTVGAVAVAAALGVAAGPGVIGASNTTTPGEGGSGEAGIGGAGIPSEPRDVAGLFDLDDGVAIWSERPEDEDRTGVSDDQIVVGIHNPSTGPADRKSTRLNSSHAITSRMPSSA